MAQKYDDMLNNISEEKLVVEWHINMMTCHLTTYQYDDWLLNNVGISRTTCWWTMYHYNDLF